MFPCCERAFYIETWTRINGKLACNQVKCTWLLPTYVNEVPYARARDINFKSAKKLKAELDLKIDDFVGEKQSRTSAQAKVSGHHGGKKQNF